jgi:hypothetical protein
MTRFTRQNGPFTAGLVIVRRNVPLNAAGPPTFCNLTDRGYERVLVQPSLIVTGGNRQAKRRAIEANHDLSFWRQALEAERLRLRLLAGLAAVKEGLLGALTAR